MRVAVDNYDYRGLAGVGDDVISMDWDTAASREDITNLAALAAEHPDEVLVAPCLNYRGNEPDHEPTYNVGWLDGANRFHAWPLAAFARALEAGSAGCGCGPDWAEHFGFGMVYLPLALINQFMAENPGKPMPDTAFADWHFRVLGRRARIAWGVRPVHLHYAAAERGTL